MIGSVWTLREVARSGPSIARPAARLLFRLAEFAYGSYVPPSVGFSGPPCFPHGMHSVFISGQAQLGVDCVIFQQVTIGSNTLADSKGFGAPLIGDRCYIGAGAKIIGGVRIGNDVRIGAGAVVTRDVPDCATVLANGEVRVAPAPRDNRYFRKTTQGWEYFRAGRWIRSEHPVQQVELAA